MKTSKGKITFKRIDNGYKCKPDYQCSNGLIIESESEPEVYRYYVRGKGFEYLKDAKAYCISFGSIKQ